MSRATATMNLVQSLAAAGRSKSLLERRLAHTALGIVQALRERKISVDEAGDELFNTDNYRQARRRKLSPQTIEMFEWGMELPDVLELTPDGLDESLHRIADLASRVVDSR